ncbi:MAG: methyltransferase domain-containing protein [Myxococcota bacterium]
MRVVDLDRDMRDVVPTGTTRDSEYLFARMTERTLGLAAPAGGRRILDVASGFGQDAIAMARRGAWAVGAEPSARMSALARVAGQQPDVRAGATGLVTPTWVRCWSDCLPFGTGSFDAVVCKGSIDHFDRPGEAIAEMARVTRRAGRVVLAIANFESLACRVARWGDAVGEGWLGRQLARGRRHYDVPSDHFTRYELDLMREQAAQSLELEVVEGISLAWGLPAWTRAVERLPAALAQAALGGFDFLARRLPALADVVLLAGRPRRARASSTTSP